MCGMDPAQMCVFFKPKYIKRSRYLSIPALTVLVSVRSCPVSDAVSPFNRSGLRGTQWFTVKYLYWWFHLYSKVDILIDWLFSLNSNNYGCLNREITFTRNKISNLKTIFAESRHNIIVLLNAFLESKPCKNAIYLFV